MNLSQKIVYTLLVLIPLLTGCQSAETPGRATGRDFDLAELDAQVQRAMSVMDIPGLALAVVDSNGVIIAKGYGVRSAGSDELVDAETLFDIGSITKAFTATAMALLVDRDQVSWSTKIQEYVPDFHLDDAWVSREFNLADALSHRGGYLDNYFYELHPEIDRSEFIERLSHSEPVYPFRTGFEYNNALYGLAAFVLEEVTGDRWQDFTTENILSPLGMNETLIEPVDLDQVENRARPHELTNNGMVELPESEWYENDPIPSTGVIVSSANDMAKWCSYVLRRGKEGIVPVLKDSTIREMQTIHVSGGFDWFPEWGYGSQRSGYGYGWQLHDYRDDEDQHIAHGGATRGMQAWMVVSRKHGYAIAVMSNAGWAGDRVHFAIANWIHDQWLGLEPVDWTGEKLAEYRTEFEKWLGEREPDVPMRPSVPLSLELADYTGAYDHPMWGPMIITQEGELLVVEMGVARAEAKHWGGDVFYLDWDGEDTPNGFITFEKGSSGKIASLTYDDGWVNQFIHRAGGN